MLTFDDHLDKRIQFGSHQIQTFGILAFSAFLAGFQVFYLIVILTIQQREFGLSQTDLKWLTSLQFAGMVVSYIIYSTLTDRIGRKNLHMTGLLLLSFGLMLHSFAYNIVIIAISRFLMGVTVGWLWGIPLITLVEIVPAKIRGRVATAGEACYILGIVYMAFSCYLAFESYTVGNWRVLSQINSILALLCFIMVLVRVDESARFHLVKGRYTLAFQGINKMGVMNKGKEYIALSEDEKTQLISWQEAYLKSQKRRPGFRALFGSGQKRITVMIWILSVFLNIQDKGVTILLPFVFASQDASLITLIVAHSVELPAAFFTGALIDSKKFGGRARGLMIGVLFLNVSLLALYFQNEYIILYAFLFVRFSVRWIWSYYNVLVVETYTTVLRSTGSGAAQMIGKVASVITPFIVLTIYFASPSGVFLFMLCVGFCAHIVLRFFPTDMTRQPLDVAKETPKKDLEVESKSSSEEAGEQEMECFSLKEIN